MSLRVYNTLTRRKEAFAPIHPPHVGVYLCGPTVYKPPHVGHLVGPVIFDVVKRYLTRLGFDVEWVVNITDVEDKLIDAAAKKGRTVEDVARQYEGEYKDCLRDLGITNIDRFPRASEHIEEIIALVSSLIERNHAYAAEGNVYYGVRSDDDYGKLSGRNVEQQESGTRDVEAAGKRDPADFALWKAAKEGEPSWDSPWGKGRPGWHIECSAMSMKYLGESFDLHGGGIDLLFPHHENELAQSESATGLPFAKCWMHNGLTRMKTKAASGEWRAEKMSGSVGNVVSARELIDTHGANLLRYLILTTHYRSPIDFSDDTVVAAKKGINTFSRLFERIERLNIQIDEHGEIGDTSFSSSVDNLRAKFLAAMDDDFNTAGAIGALHELAGEINAYIERVGLERTPDDGAAKAVGVATARVVALGSLLGVFEQPVGDSKLKYDEELKRFTRRYETPVAGASGANTVEDDLMHLLIELRAEARSRKDFALADGIRARLVELGITLEDRTGGTEWRRE